jgi:hypothetical protein
MKETVRKVAKEVGVYSIAAGLVTGGGVMLGYGIAKDSPPVSSEIQALEAHLEVIEGLEDKTWEEIQVKVKNGETVTIDISELETKKEIIASVEDEILKKIEKTKEESDSKTTLMFAGIWCLIAGIGATTVRAMNLPLTSSHVKREAK